MDGAKLMQVLDEQNVAVHNLVRNTGRVFGAINERRGALRELIVNSKRVFEATASRDKALAETFSIFPTFLDESKATMARLEDFSRNTHPLVNDLKGPADDLGPDGARPRQPRARPREPVPRPERGDSGQPHGRCRRSRRR